MKVNSAKYAKYDNRPGFVPEQDGHFTVNYLPVVDGFTAHAVKRRPSLALEQWVEVIHRNGDHSYGPVETYAWGIHPCHQNDREDYKQPGHRGKPVHEILDLEITHYRTIDTPPDGWMQGDPFPGKAIEREWTEATQ